MKFPSPLRTPLGAALLSALFPGLGQAAAGKPGRGAIVAIPALAVLGALGFILLFYRHSLLDSAFNQAWLTSLLLLDLVALVYHLWAVADSYLLAGRGQQVQPGRRRRTTPSTPKWGATIGVIVIVSGTVTFHAAFASVDMSWQNGISCISAITPCFASGTLAPGQTIANTTDQPDVPVDPSETPGGSGPVASASASIGPVGTLDLSKLPSFSTPPEAKNWAADGQLNVLMVGVDYETNSSRTQGLRPDTMIVLHVDIRSGKAAMISVPRNTMCVPLPRGIAENYPKSVQGCPPGTWGYMLNWLANEAGWNHPGNFPFDQGPGLEYARAINATELAIGALTDLTIDGYVVINLEGLVTLIDDLGGISINVPTKVYDMPCGPAGTWESKFRVCSVSPPHDGYQVPPSTPDVIDRMKANAAQSGGKQSITWSGGTTAAGTDIAFTILPGEQHMDGQWALAYARTRIYTTDYDRSIRQQLVLKSLRNSLDPCSVLPRIPSLIDDLSMFWTNLPLSDASQWAGLAKSILGGNVKSINLDPTTLGNPGVTYINQTTWAKAKDIVAHSLDGVPAASPSGGSGGGGGGGGFGC